LREAHQALKNGRWGGWRGYDRFFAQELNGAHLAAVAAYNDGVPAFEALLAREGGDLPRFYEAVRQLAALPKAQRDRELLAIRAARG
jgi:predicted aminopeptidase